MPRDHLSCDTMRPRTAQVKTPRPWSEALLEHPGTILCARSSANAFTRLSVRGLDVRIEGRPVVRDVSLDVAQGEVVGLLGRDGAGKTSCFEALAGLTRASRGAVLLNGEDVSRLSADERARRGLSYLPEAVCVFRGLTAAENIAMALEAAESDPALRPLRLERLLDRFQLAGLRDQPALSLSGGERRRCEVARAMATDPTVLMLDEPFRGLDPMSVREVEQTLLALKGGPVAVLISDYDLHAMLHLIDRAYVLDQGEIIFGGGVDALLADRRVRQLYLGEGFSL